MNVVWLKKDIRMSDHAPLYFAIAEQSPFVIIFCFEPLIETSETFNVRHWWFLWHSLQALQQDLAKFGIALHIAYEDVLPLLTRIDEKYGIKTLFSHQETGVLRTYERDKAVKNFCQEKNILWREFEHNGIVRGLTNIHELPKYRNQYLRQATYEPHFKDAQIATISPDVLPPLLPNALPQGVINATIPFAPNESQIAGEKQAWQLLHQFAAAQPSNYGTHTRISEPIYSYLSAHITYGNISIRQIMQFIAQHEMPHLRHLKQLKMGLRLRMNLVQQFEMECRMEYENLNFAYNGIRIKQNEAYLNVWRMGKTGFPLIDAAMRCVSQTGYLSNSLRIAVIAFLTQHLWLDWRKGGATYLAQLFLDFEAGIHYPQIQIQATCTGIHKVHIYNPIKQAREIDPKAVFIKQWLPELGNLPPELCHNPSVMTTLEQQLYHFEVGKTYPLPIVDIAKTEQFANMELNRIKNSTTARQESVRILAKHGNGNSNV